LLDRSAGLSFHASDYVAIEAAEFAIRSPRPVLVADDPTYEIAAGAEGLVLFRLGGEETRMPSRVPWQDVDYLFCAALGVEP
ncbi:MAG: hypothetical protein K8I02_05785, partial [Candidatus Methylomirabilis sp.]|nr:hypothetical protein [Deltaproteobacteria bacterium]